MNTDLRKKCLAFFWQADFEESVEELFNACAKLVQSLSLSVQSVFTDLFHQSGTANSEFFGSPGHHATRFIQRLLN